MKKLLFICLLTILTGCKTIEPLYYYGEYNDAVYSYFKAEEVSLEQQITAMQTTIQDAEAQGKIIAPGIHAHLAMLYFESGDASLGSQHFAIEKQLYPESAHFIDFLMTAAKGSNNESS